jgi:hypothetical protein
LTDDIRAGAAREEDERRHGDHGPSVGPASTGAGGSIAPLLIGALLLIVVLGFQVGAFGWIADHFGVEPSSNEAKMAAMTEAEIAVAQALNTASSMVFDDVQGFGAHEACGVVKATNHDGTTSEKRFIFQAGVVRLDDGSDDFERVWAANVCQPVRVAAVAAGRAAPPRRTHYRLRGPITPSTER